MNASCLLTAFKRVSNIFSTALGRDHISERVCTRSFLAFQIRFYPENCCSIRINYIIEIVGLHIFYFSKLCVRFFDKDCPGDVKIDKDFIKDKVNNSYFSKVCINNNEIISQYFSAIQWPF
jgi:hypothetical protein